MFVKVTNGTSTLEVTQGAYDSIYKGMGFVVVAELGTQGEFESVPGEVAPSADEAFVEAMKEKPISQWSKGELRKVVKIMNIDTSSLENVSEVRECVKKVLFG